MRPELEHKLIKRFPYLYRGYYQPMDSTCMCWGFSHCDGWFKIIWMLSLAIEDDLNMPKWKMQYQIWSEHIARKWNNIVYKLSKPRHDDWLANLQNKYFPKKSWNYIGIKWFVWHPNRFNYFSVTQVKEKFGTLRYYCSGNDNICDFIDYAEHASEHTCEACGEYGKLRDDGWLVTQCDKCYKKK